MLNLKKLLSLSLVIAFGTSIVPSVQVFNNEVSAATINIATIDPSLQYQTMDGWGTSLAWWAKLVGEWNTDAKNEIMDLAFDLDKGLGLNLVRYNIGGAKSPMDTNLRPGADIESYLDPDGSTYDWTKDVGQRWVLNEAKNRISTNEFKSEAFSNSPPYFMTISGQSSGNIGGKSNLKYDQYDNFANYLTEVVKHFNSDYGITFDTIDPMNEPSTNYWKKGGNQEGCDFDDPLEKDKIFQKLSKSFSDNNITTKLAGFDETGIDYSADAINKAAPETIEKISQFNTHVYSDGSRTNLRDLAASLEKPLYMNEICTSGGAKHDANDMDNGLKLADYIFKDLRDLNTPAWYIWQAVDDEEMNQSNNSNWGLISAYWSGDDAEKYFITKQYYAMAHFSKFIRPGYKIIDANSSNVIAAIDPASENLVLVTRNTSENDEQLMLDISKFDTEGATIKAYRTSGTESLADISSDGITLINGALKDNLPGKSMVTYVISNAKYSGEIGKVINDNVIGSNDNQFQYSDSWNYYNAQNGAYSNDVHYSNKIDSYYKVKFNGDRVKLYGSLANDSGIAAISIDDGEEINIDLYSDTRKDNALMYMSPILDDKEHTLKVRVTGNKNDAARDTYILADRVVVIKNSKDEMILPKAPQLTELTASYNSLYIRYNAIEGATSYNVKYGTSSGDYTEVIDGITDTSYLITGLENETKYYVAVSAVINGQESNNSNELVEAPIAPANLDLLYYVNCGDATPNILENDEVFGTNNSTQDQAYGPDPLTKYNWGYIADEDKQWSQDIEAAVGSNYGCERQYDGNKPQGGLTYKFDLPNGKYTVIMGFYDPWNHTGRLEDILINGKLVAEELCPTIIGKVPNYYMADVDDGVLTVRAQKSINGNDKPLISWIKVEIATDSEEPTNPDTPTEPTDPEEPTNPDIPTEPTDPEEPTNPDTPTEPTDPEEPTNPDIPTEPTDPEEPTNPDTPTEPTDPEEPTNPDTPTEPTDPEEPTNPDIPTEPTDPEEPTNPDTPTEPTDPEEPTNPDTPTQITKTYVISVKSGAHGSISPNGEVNVVENKEQTFTIKPDSKYRIGDVKVDGVSVGAVSSYSFKDVTSAHTISATFKLKKSSSKSSSSSVNNVVDTVTTNSDEVAILDAINSESIKTIVIDINNSNNINITDMNSGILGNNPLISESILKVLKANKDKTLVIKTDDSNIEVKSKDGQIQFTENGTIITGFKLVGKDEYYLDENGIMKQGWVETLDNNWYYLSPVTGIKTTNWIKDTKGNWYYLDDNSGAMKTGWVKDNGKWYYLNDDGSMKIGWLKDNNGKWYYLNTNGAMTTNVTIDGYYIDSNGAWSN